MKKLFMSAVVLFAISQSFAQKTEPAAATSTNSWLKAGFSVGVPVGRIADYSSVTAGLELSGQIMQTQNFGLGLATGYTHFFGKDKNADFGVIPVGLMLRYYPAAKGFFVGSDLGYSFLTNVDKEAGGFYVKPQLGYHDYNWNIFGFYNQVFRKTGYTDVQNVGLAATYNLRFK